MAKIVISLPEELLASLDTEARARDLTRSALIIKAIRREISERESSRIDELLGAAQAAMRNTGAWSAEDVLSQERAGH